MKGLELLTFLTKEDVDRLKLSAQNYQRFARIYFSIVSFNGNEIIVKIWQKENVLKRYLSTKELIERGNEVFSGIIPADVKIHFRPIPFKIDTLGNVDAKYVRAQMEKHGLKVGELGKLLDIDKGTLSRTLSSDSMTKSSKAMFYYLFKSLPYIQVENKKTAEEAAGKK